MNKNIIVDWIMVIGGLGFLVMLISVPCVIITTIFGWYLFLKISGAISLIACFFLFMAIFYNLTNN